MTTISEHVGAIKKALEFYSHDCTNTASCPSFHGVEVPFCKTMFKDLPKRAQEALKHLEALQQDAAEPFPKLILDKTLAPDQWQIRQNGKVVFDSHTAAPGEPDPLYRCIEVKGDKGTYDSLEAWRKAEGPQTALPKDPIIREKVKLDTMIYGGGAFFTDEHGNETYVSPNDIRPQPTPEPLGCREAFEARGKKLRWNLFTFPNGEYETLWMQKAWEAWQDCWNQRITPEPLGEDEQRLYKYARIAMFAMKNVLDDLKTRNVLVEKEFMQNRLENAITPLEDAIQRIATVSRKEGV